MVSLYRTPTTPLQKKLLKAIQKRGTYDKAIAHLRVEPVFSTIDRTTLFRWLRVSPIGRHLRFKIELAINRLLRDSTTPVKVRAASPVRSLVKDAVKDAAQIQNTVARFQRTLNKLLKHIE